MPDATVFRLVVEALVHGSGYERIAIEGCSDWTIRDRVKTWSALGLAHELHRLALAAYDQMIGLDLNDLSADGCHTKAPVKGDKAGRSPVDRGKQGLKRSTLVEARGVPLGIASDGANRHDSKLLEPTITAAKHQLGALPTKARIHLDSAYNGKPCRKVLDDHDLIGEIAAKGVQVTETLSLERDHRSSRHLSAVKEGNAMPSVIKSVSFDAADALALARFWAAALGSDVDEDSTVDKAFVEASGWGAPNIWFTRVPEPKAAKNRVHFDLRAPGPMADEVARLEAIGATVIQRFDHLVSMRDPEGNEFCVEPGPTDGRPEM